MTCAGDEVVIIATGIANTASVDAAFARLGVGVVHTTDPRTVEQARALVLPGVGSFGAGMQVLRRLGLVGVLQERLDAGRGTLAVCLGLQLLCRGSEESGGIEGLGIIDAIVRRFPDGVPVPQFGWNAVKAPLQAMLVQSGYAYFANSYRIDARGSKLADWTTSTSEYAGPFVAAIERGAVLGCQFHPEISGPWGHALLGRWLTCSREGVTTC